MDLRAGGQAVAVAVRTVSYDGSAASASTACCPAGDVVVAENKTVPVPSPAPADWARIPAGDFGRDCRGPTWHFP
ncbi:hypothetical protein GCM10023083_24460 [Streptomyces phyllanthi]